MFQNLVYETPAPGVARIVLNRPESRNAQDTRLLYELNDAFDRAAKDDQVSVIILAANGPHFSSGHDLREKDPIGSLAEFDTVGTWCGFGCAGAEGWMAREKELYIGLSERWRNIPKPTIAAVHGKCIAGGLMLIWPCDLIVASEDATFADNTVSMGMTGVEYFGHPWELGPRKAKELLFTSDWMSAAEAHRLGMVNHVVPKETLSDFTLDLASRIAQKPLFALKLAKEAVNAAEDAQGRISAMQTAFALHQLGHSHNMQVHGLPIDPRGTSGLVPAKS
ncbi:MAG: enoyl-CoA hydratase/isomerase family protein [Phenylobacterium sp.]|jgi:enoyl-CoA hydratase|nr:enoyl-CoA hydratase/isomerase family protein [Phenylobacterium sp.]